MPAVYADAGRSGGQLAALAEAITGRHDGVFATHPSQLGDGIDRSRHRPAPPPARHATTLPLVPGGDRHPRAVRRDPLRRDFTVTDEHLQLFRRAHVFWDEAEFGAPSINPKRPYGNSNVYADIAEILDAP